MLNRMSYNIITGFPLKEVYHLEIVMLKSYKAIYNHGNIEWLDGPPDSEYTPILIVVEEPGAAALDGDNTLKNTCNGNRLVTILDNWPSELRSEAADKFGDPLHWQKEQQQERPQPGREEA